MGIYRNQVLRLDRTEKLVVQNAHIFDKSILEKNVALEDFQAF
jgi:hypothetical protein